MAATVARVAQAQLKGLSSAQAVAMLHRAGPNRLPAPAKERLTARILRQIREPMALLLLGAATISVFALGEMVDGLAIAAIVVLNASIGLFQETKAEHALEALRDLQTPVARVLRDGISRSVPAAEVVIGDVVLLAGGDSVAADGDLIEAVSLEVDESLLTGESLPVAKTPSGDAGLYAGTYVTAGTGVLQVRATGSGTRLASIAAGLETDKPVTPLQTELHRVSIWLGAIALVAAGIVFMLVATSGGEHVLEDALLTAISVAVAAVPEGLATVVTVALALGVGRMAGRGAIVRHLPSVETLGATTVIATDKTGTLTENRMRVAVSLDATGMPASGETHTELATAVAACNDATLEPPSGDPLEIALLEWAASRGPVERLSTVPFDSERKMMSTIHVCTDGFIVYTKGAPEQVLKRSTRYQDPSGDSRPLEPDDRAEAASIVSRAAETGVRMLAVAKRLISEPPASPDEAETDLTLIGFVGLRDPVRAEASEAVATAQRAGVEVVMVTGDHPGTAQWVASEVGIAAGSRTLSIDPFYEGILPGRSVYARVSPEDKIALVRALQANGEVVAVTGDGVNDGPALRGANIGIAMGKRGTDVARAASDLVITDDNLGTIVHAIREGRSIYDNIRRVVQYLLAANLSEILVVVVGLVMFPELAPPLLPLQLLWINLVTDGLPALALGVDPVDPLAMQRGPRALRSRLLGVRGLTTIGVRAAVFATSCLGAVAAARWVWHADVVQSRTVLFISLALGQLIYSFVVRRPAISVLDHDHTPTSSRLRSNPWLVGAAVVGIAMLALPLLIPVLRDVFGVQLLVGWGMLLALAAAVVPNLLIVAVEPPSRRA